MVARSNSTIDASEAKAALADRLATLHHRRAKTFAAAEWLFFAKSLYPSAALVRSVTEQGSLSDINDDLRDFWQEVRRRGNPSVSTLAGLPEHLASAFAPAIEAMWLSALDSANASVASARQSFSQAVEDARRAADVSRELAEDARARLADAEARIEEGRAVAATLQDSLRAARSELELAEQTAERLRADLRTSEDARAQLQELLGTGLGALKQSSDKASEAFLGEIRYLKVQLDGARAAERDLREQIQSGRQGASLEVQILRQQNNGLLETNGRLNLQNQDLTEKLTAALAQLSRRS